MEPDNEKQRMKSLGMHECWAPTFSGCCIPEDLFSWGLDHIHPNKRT
jgi:hypothetical protein